MKGAASWYLRHLHLGMYTNVASIRRKAETQTLYYEGWNGQHRNAIEVSLAPFEEACQRSALLGTKGH